MTKNFRTPITVGADPELFLMKDKEFVSGHDAVPGTKYNPFRVKGGAVQVDGTAVEFNINPALTADEFSTNIALIIERLEVMVASVDPKFRLVCAPVAYYTKDYWETIPTKAKVLGCEPDYNAYTQDENERPDGEVTFRTGSGHVHIGWTEDQDPHSPEHFHDCLMAIKQIDSILYPVSFFWDKDTKRRELYGAPGAFRPKSYGAEYRTLSNVWLSDVDIQEWIFNSVVHGMHLLEDRVFLYNKPYVQKSVKKGTFTEKELHHYHGFLQDFGFAKLPESYLSD